MYRHYILTLLVAVFFLFSTETSSIASTLRHLIIKSTDDSPYSAAAEGIQEAFRSTQFKIEWDIKNIDKDFQKSQLEKKVHEGYYDLIFSVGSDALEFVKPISSKTPVVFTMVMGFNVSGNDSDQKLPGNITGVNLLVEPSIWFNTYKKLLPDIKRVGVIYNPRVSNKILEHAELAAKNMGFTLVKVQIDSSQEIKEALEIIRKNADTLWTITDSYVINSLSMKQILIFTLKHKIPLFTITPQLVRLGGLLSISSDYKRVGVQTGEVGLDILKGRNPSDISVSGPRDPVFSINMHTADILGLTVPDSVLKEIQNVFQ